MICRDCHTEHPPGDTANPHYCIARMQERIEKLEADLARANDAAADMYRIKETWAAKIAREARTRKPLRDIIIQIDCRLLQCDICPHNVYGWCAVYDARMYNGRCLRGCIESERDLVELRKAKPGQGVT